LDRLARLAITHLATALIVHCQRARTLVREHFFRQDGVFVIPHGNFIDAYPNTLTREEARQRLGLPEERFVYLFFGAVRPYKGLERLLEVFSGLKGEHLTLLLAARVYDPYSAKVVERATQADPRVVVCPSRFFLAEELQLYFNAADVVVLPFHDILTSGSLITALSFGRPVIVPATGCLPETVDDNMGILYDPRQPHALAQAMEVIRQRDLDACGVAAFRRAESLSWETIARLTLEAYRC
jgi:glycosyltransferase involved in cell wall biosynthesis